MIHVCDAIMGSGKSQAAIAYMNAHPDQKFIYAAPYIEETERIRDGCPALNFICPRNDLKDFEFSKVEHTKSLLLSGANITTTHSAFRLYTEDMVDAIRKYHYTLIIDEAVDILCELDYNYEDVKTLLDAGYIRVDDNGEYVATDDCRNSVGALQSVYDTIRAGHVVGVEESLLKKSKKEHLLYWLMPDTILKSFDTVFVLSYLFDGQEMKCYLDLKHLEYNHIGVRRSEDGTYSFSEDRCDMPAYLENLSSLIHIFDNKKLNALGEKKFALSMAWLSNPSGKLDRLTQAKNAIYSYFKYYNANASHSRCLWTTAKKAYAKMRPRGFGTRFLAFNARATNKYRECDVLAYRLNVCPSPTKMRYLSRNETCSISLDQYALSTMLQWIWRSAIRDGKEIWIYVPSKRMRTLLENWIVDVELQYQECKEGLKQETESDLP